MATSILITGGTGFVGSAILEALEDKHPEWALSVLDLRKPSHPKGQVRYAIGDIRKAAEVKAIIDDIRPTAIVHCAGFVPALASRYNRKERDRVFSVNVNGTRIILDAARSANVKAVVWTGSFTAVTDDVRFDYPNIDETAEEIVLAANDQDFLTCALRPSVIFGPGDEQLIPSIYACIAKGETPFIIGNGLNLWDITYVSNVADAHVLAIENLLSSKTAAGQAIFISNEEPIPFRDFCLAVWREFGHYPPFELRIPRSVAAFAGSIADLVSWLSGTPTTLSRGSVQDACSTRYCSGEKARKILGYVPRVGIEEGIRRSCEEYKKRLEQ